ncbi:MAG: FlgD immunoglobulin-like domain containing protein, partial [Candidatus Eisenbacteria bacterium]|nr:FlgD immunoglobulin-like domain containing protein [Candidatus Eisenbacteria bacterium]
FEMVLYDPVRYPTATGEGRIRFQYLQHDPQQTFHTVGIENGTEQCGVEIWNDGVWPPLGPAPGPALASVRAPSSNDPMKLSRFQSGAEAQAGGHAEEGEREETPIVPGMQIDFEPVAHGDEFAPLPPSALAVDYLEPDVRISWTNPTHNTNGVELTYLDHVCLSQDGQMMAEVLGEPGESMQYELRGAGSGTHLYAVYACVGEQESGPAQQAFTVPQVAHYRDNPPNNVVLTVTDQGTCGFLNADPQQGSGFRFGPGGANCLFVGSLWAATGPYYALNNDYADDAYQDWRFLKSYGAGNDPASLIAGCDDAGHYGAAGLEVWQQTRSWPDPPNNDFVMIDYNLRNTSDERIENLYVGQFMDWDIGDAMNQGRANAATNMAYMYKDASSPYAGVALLGESPANLALIHNPTFVWPQASILDLDRFFFLAAADGDHSVSQTWETNDWSAVVSVGPIVLEPGAMRRVSFAVIGGANEADLIANAQAAQQKYASAPSSIEEPVPATAFTTDLLPVQPNPFGASATIRYRLATAGPVTLAIYDAGGRLVRRWSEPARTVGEHAVVWDGRDDQGSVQPSGIYFCTIRADGQTRTEKMILLRARR